MRIFVFSIILCLMIVPVALSGAPVYPKLTPTPTPTPYPTFCDIMIQADVFVYDGPGGQSYPVAGALIEPVSSTCPYNSWNTSVSGWANIIYPNYNFDMDIRISHPDYYDSEYNISSGGGPYYIGLSPIVTPTETPPPPHDGDVNQDGVVTAEDAQMAFQFALGQISLDWVQEIAADCNGDFEVTAGDAQLIFFTALGTHSCVDPI